METQSREGGAEILRYRDWRLGGLEPITGTNLNREPVILSYQLATYFIFYFMASKRTIYNSVLPTTNC